MGFLSFIRNNCVACAGRQEKSMRHPGPAVTDDREPSLRVLAAKPRTERVAGGIIYVKDAL